METATPPVRIIAPGSAYRRDEIDATHLSVFNQLEGLFVAEDVKLGDLKLGDNGPVIQLRLSLDQRAVQIVTARQPGSR